MKIIVSLSKKYSVIALGWDRQRNHQAHQVVGRSVHIRLMESKAPTSTPILVVYYPLFWAWVLANLVAERPRAIHACDLETLIPAFVYRSIFGCKLIFDSYDRYSMAFIPPKFETLYAFVDWIESLLAFKCDLLVTVSNQRLSTFPWWPRMTSVIMNCPQDMKNPAGPHMLSNSTDTFRMGFAGLITQNRGLRVLTRVVSKHRGLELVLAGIVLDDAVRIVQDNPQDNPGIRYLGILDYSQAIEMEASVDVIPILYDPAIPINNVASPNKLFEAMMLGVPVISNVCRDIVTETGCGIVVGYNTYEVERAIDSLRSNPGLRKEMGIRGRQAFERSYNWILMEERLLRLYSKLLGQS